MDRRRFLRLSVAGSVGAASFGADFWRALYAAPAEPGRGPYGSIEGRSPDENGLILPDGFTSRVIGRAGEPVVGTELAWHAKPDGGATFPLEGGGWAYVSNSEVDHEGGVSAVHFAPDGTITGAHRLLEGTRLNCSGGPTPWGTWLSCEEYDALDDGGSSAGQVWECDPSGRAKATVWPALGAFKHEAVAVDPEERCLYLSEDQPDGRFYRFRPDRWPDLGSGTLEVAYESASGRVTWVPVPDPLVEDGTPTRRQVELSTAYDGGEGLWYDGGGVYLTTKGDNKVRRYDTRARRMEVIYDAAQVRDAPLTGVDNITLAASGDAFVAEDGGNMELVMITRERTVAPFLRVVGADGSELCGPAFSPDGSRLYLSSMRGGDDELGVTYEVTGPFRGARGGRRQGGTAEALRAAGGGSGFGAPELGALGLSTAVVAGASAAILRRRSGTDPAH